MKKILSLLALSLLVPIVASAAWWNPATWFKKSVKNAEPAAVEMETPMPAQEEATTTEATSTPQILPIAATSSDSELKHKYDALMLKYNSLLKKINSCQANLDTYQKKDALATHSDYIFKYNFSNNQFTILASANRSLSLKKASFLIPDSLVDIFSSDTITDHYMMVDGKKFDLTRDGSAFLYSGTPINFTTSSKIAVVVRGDSTYALSAPSYYLSIWDNDLNKPVEAQSQN